MNYTGTTDGAAKGERPGTEKLVELMLRRDFTNLGTWAVRNMRGTDRLSVHATGRAADLGFKDPTIAAKYALWLVANYKLLGIEEVHDYSGTTKKGTETWGRGWRCNRNGKPGWKDWTPTENGGSGGGKWLHVELTPAMADNPDAFLEAWKSVPRPN